MLIPPSQSASSLLFASLNAPRFSCGSAALDALFTPASHTAKPGLAHGTTLELIGPPGIGKTRTALGFVLDARFDAIASEERCEVLVVDAEGSLSPELIYSTAQLFASHNSRARSAARQVCEGIHFKRICDASTLVAFFYTLPAWLDAHPYVKLIVLDSLTAHFRPATHDYQTREMIQNLIKSTLASLTTSGSISFVVTTQLSLKLFSPDGHPTHFTADAEALLVPQLGDSWLGGPCWRVVLYYSPTGERQASAVSAPVPARAREAVFQMDPLGPCDFPDGAQELMTVDEDEDDALGE